MKLATCLPFYSTDCKVYFALSLLFTEWPDCESVVLKTLGVGTAQAKMHMTDVALKWGADYIVYINSDSAWEPDTVKRLLAHDKQVVSGWGSSRFAPFFTNIADQYDDKARMFHFVGHAPKRHGLEQVKMFGEFHIIRRDVFDIIPRPWFFGPDMIKPESVMTEDTYFCSQADKHGVEIWVDWDVPIMHGADGLVTLDGTLKAYR